MELLKTASANVSPQMEGNKGWISFPIAILGGSGDLGSAASRFEEAGRAMTERMFQLGGRRDDRI